MGFIIGENSEAPVGLTCTSWADDPTIPRLKLGEDTGRRSTTWVRGIVLHTTRGIPGGKDKRQQRIVPGIGPRGEAVRIARVWASDPRKAGAHLVVDHDGSIVCVADLLLDRAFHAGNLCHDRATCAGGRELSFRIARSDARRVPETRRLQGHQLSDELA